MAQRAETLKIEIETEEPVRLLPVKASEELKQDTLTEIKRAASGNYEDAKTWAIESYARIAERSGILAARARRNFQVMRDDRPLLIVALAAGTAFLFGVVLRVWRSKYDE